MGKALSKILFADDDPDIHLILNISLQAIPNVEIKSALSGEEAVKIAMEFLPDLILLDVMMPKMDGIVTLKTLRLLPTFSKTPVIFLTAKSQKNEVEEYLKLGILDVVIKPFDPIKLPTTLLELWEKYQRKNSLDSSV